MKSAVRPLHFNKLGWRLGLQAITGLLCLAFFLPVVYRSANLYHPQRRAITHLKNQRKKMKQKKSHSSSTKPSVLDVTPLKSHGLRVLMLACGFAALGVYTPVFYLVYHGYKEKLEDSALVLLQTFMGFGSALGCVGCGLITVKASSQCLISRRYLCQVTMVGIGISLLALSAVQGYHGYVLFVWIYGTCLGGYTYTLKMFALERIRGKHFTKAWSFIQSAKSVPVLIGVPITGYINQSYPKAGYYFSFMTTILGASLMFFVGTRKDPTNSNTNHCNANTCSVVNLNTCVCNSAVNYRSICAPEIQHYKFFRNNCYKNLLSRNYFSQTNLNRSSIQFSVPSIHGYLPKSFSCASNIDRFPYFYPIYFHDYAKMPSSELNRNILRLSKSVPEGLAQGERCSFHKRQLVKNVQVIEQITTSV